MNAWEEIFISLSAHKFFARWHTKSGGFFYMYLPAADEIGSDRLCGELSTPYDDLAAVEIIRDFSYGKFSITSDIDLVRSCLSELDCVKLTPSEDGISIELRISH